MHGRNQGFHVFDRGYLPPKIAAEGEAFCVPQEKASHPLCRHSFIASAMVDQQSEMVHDNSAAIP